MHKKNVTKPPKKKVSPEDVLINAEFMTALALELMLREDERIRKNCIHFLELQKVHHADTSEIDDCIAYLERQKEQKPVISDDAIRDGVAHFGITQYQINNWLKKHINVVEQKPAEWSEEDEKMRASIIMTLAGFMGNEEKISWLKTLRPNHWKPSEEQMKALEDAKMRMSLDGYGLCPLLQTLINDLKSL